MKLYVTNEWYNVEGRGLIALIKHPNNLPSKGEIISINAKEFKVVDVEVSRGIKIGSTVGFVVTPIEKAQPNSSSD